MWQEEAIENGFEEDVRGEVYRTEICGMLLDAVSPW